ncbi:MAG TPA: DMT family transporter [Gemmatimonas sp.]|uniref:DMT family transporter n=1 Tax=Gemmatimonas sp. TaxID=1962908 RepID=UPI002ED81CCE
MPSDTASGPSPHSRQGFGATDAWLVFMAVIWGVNYSVVKAGLAHLSPLVFNGTRMVLATVVLFTVAAFVRGTPWPKGRERIQLLLIGLLGNGLYQVLFIFGLSRTRAGVAALIVAATPAWIAIISQVIGRERVTRISAVGIGMQLLGVACVVGSAHGFGGDGGGVMWGAALMAGGSVCWALFTVLLQPHTQRAHPLHLSAVTMTSGAVLIVSISLPDMLRLDWGAVPLSAWGSVVYAGIGALVVAYLLYYHGVRVLGPTRTSMYSNLQPVIALGVAWLMLHEQPSGWQLLGAAFILGGLLLSRVSRRTAASPAGTSEGLRRA